MFDALANGRIDAGGLEFDLAFADIEELNSLAVSGKADVCKVSYAVLPAIAADYRVLTSGSALGRGNGPLLVSREPVDLSDGRLRLAVPGELTTANLLIQRLFSALKNRTPVLFSQIADRVMAGDFDAGVLIHEGRFTYAARGLRLCADLGAEWERRVALPLPLGAIVVARRLGERVARQVDALVRASVEHAFAHPSDSSDFVRAHARELDTQVIADHISLFVNDFSLEIGAEGRRAVRELTGVGDEIFVQ
jgi:1,4-dihydroxy-6-naphthoate synthase